MFTSAENPVLAAFREHVATSNDTTPEVAAHWLANFAPFWHSWRGGRIPARKAHREHAKKVFRRLAALG